MCVCARVASVQFEKGGGGGGGVGEGGGGVAK